MKWAMRITSAVIILTALAMLFHAPYSLALSIALVLECALQCVFTGFDIRDAHQHDD